MKLKVYKLLLDGHLRLSDDERSAKVLVFTFKNSFWCVEGVSVSESFFLSIFSKICNIMISIVNVNNRKDYVYIPLCYL